MEHQYFDKKGQKYICRCVGVTFDEFKEFVHENSLKSLVDLTDELGVAAGCASCLCDVKQMISRLECNNKKSPAEMIYEVSELLESWKKLNDFNEYSFEIVSFQDQRFVIKTNLDEKNELVNFFRERYRDIEFNFCH